jgi:hypothetical protein
LNFQLACLSLPSDGIIGICHHTQVKFTLNNMEAEISWKNRDEKDESQVKRIIKSVWWHMGLFFLLLFVFKFFHNIGVKNNTM